MIVFFFCFLTNRVTWSWLCRRTATRRWRVRGKWKSWWSVVSAGANQWTSATLRPRVDWLFLINGVVSYFLQPASTSFLPWEPFGWHTLNDVLCRSFNYIMHIFLFALFSVFDDTKFQWENFKENQFYL